MQSNPDFSSAAPVLIIIFGLIFLLALALIVLMVVSMWVMFKKAGEPGWKAVIPVYNGIILQKISGIPMPLILGLMASVFVVSVYAAYDKNMAVMAVGNVFSFFYTIFVSYCMCRAFSGGVGMTVLTIFFPFISMPIIAFSKPYIGFWQTQGALKPAMQDGIYNASSEHFGGDNPFNNKPSAPKPPSPPTQAAGGEGSGGWS